jgi:hypothetical protein
LEPEAHEVDAAEHARIYIVSKRSGGKPSVPNSIVPMSKMPARETADRKANTRNIVHAPESASSNKSVLTSSDKPGSRVSGDARSQPKSLSSLRQPLSSAQSNSSDGKQHFTSSLDESKETIVRQQYHNSLLKLKASLVQSQQQSSLQTNANSSKSSGASMLAAPVPDLASDIANLCM